MLILVIRYKYDGGTTIKKCWFYLKERGGGGGGGGGETTLSIILWPQILCHLVLPH